MNKYTNTIKENVEDTFLSDKLKEISEKQSELFDKKALYVLDNQALIKLQRLIWIEIKRRNLHYWYHQW